jgi:hypothetical protein
MMHMPTVMQTIAALALIAAVVSAGSVGVALDKPNAPGAAIITVICSVAIIVIALY